MGYKVDWVSPVAFGIITDGGRPIVLPLEENQTIPPEFQPGDELHVVIQADHQSRAAMGMPNSGFYEITHLPSGKTVRAWFRAVEDKKGTNL